MLTKSLKPLLKSCRETSSINSWIFFSDLPKIDKAVAPLKEKPDELKRKFEFSKSVTKDDMKWRKPWHETEKNHYMGLRSFYSEHNNIEVMKFLRSPIDLSPSSIKKWWARKQKEKQIIMQSYIPERVEILGVELAAAHFIVFRGGAVKFFGEDSWIKANEYNEYSLPKHYQEDKILQGIDCSDVELHYEGLVNFRNLRQVEWLSFNNCKYIDDWCMDTVSNIFSHSLIYLDIRNCENITHRGLGALHKIQSLKILCIDKMYKSDEYEMTCLMLKDLLPELDIQMIDD